MRKKSLKNLNLNKKSISNFNLVGGANTTIIITTHSISWCNPNGFGCPSEFLTACQPPEDTTSIEFNTTGSVNCIPQSVLMDCGIQSETCEGLC
jgi:hypothetical protein